MRIKVQDVLPYAHLLDFTDPVTACTLKFRESVNHNCNSCPFLCKDQFPICSLSTQDKHYPQLLTALKAPHPELFV